MSFFTIGRSFTTLNGLLGRNAFIRMDITYVVLVMHKCEIFDCLDSRNFYITKPNWEGDLGTGIFFTFGADRVHF